MGRDTDRGSRDWQFGGLCSGHCYFLSTPAPASPCLSLPHHPGLLFSYPFNLWTLPGHVLPVLEWLDSGRSPRWCGQGRPQAGQITCAPPHPTPGLSAGHMRHPDRHECGPLVCDCVSAARPAPPHSTTGAGHQP